MNITKTEKAKEWSNYSVVSPLEKNELALLSYHKGYLAASEDSLKLIKIIEEKDLLIEKLVNELEKSTDLLNEIKHKVIW
jgi:hypothetical protein